MAVSILMDSDISDEETQKQEMRSLDIPVFDWEQGYAIEEQIFQDVSLECATQPLNSRLKIFSPRVAGATLFSFAAILQVPAAGRKKQPALLRTVGRGLWA